MVRRRLRAVLMKGNHLVATTTSPGSTSSSSRARLRHRSDAPRPYASAVSNQLIPSSIETRTISRTSSLGSASQKPPMSPFPSENCQHPRPMGEIWISVAPKGRRSVIMGALCPFQPLREKLCEGRLRP